MVIPEAAPTTRKRHITSTPKRIVSVSCLPSQDIQFQGVSVSDSSVEFTLNMDEMSDVLIHSSHKLVCVHVPPVEAAHASLLLGSNYCAERPG